jgi:hypothetical protein
MRKLSSRILVSCTCKNNARSSRGRTAGSFAGPMLKEMWLNLHWSMWLSSSSWSSTILMSPCMIAWSICPSSAWRRSILFHNIHSDTIVLTSGFSQLAVHSKMSGIAPFWFSKHLSSAYQTNPGKKFTKYPPMTAIRTPRIVSNLVILIFELSLTVFANRPRNSSMMNGS